MARPSSLPKNSKAELNFRESNETASPYDLIDRNIPGIEHRIRLYELRRLKEQHILDKHDLECLKLKNLPNIEKSAYISNLYFELSYSSASIFPGLSSAIDASLNPCVYLRVKFDYSKLSNANIHKIKKLMNLSEGASECSFVISDFPLIAQNKARAIEIIKTIDDVTNNELNTEKSMSSLIAFQVYLLKSNPNYSDKNKAQEFPAEWLQCLQSKKQH